MKKRFLLALTVVLLALTACVLPEKEDPFERLPEESLEVIEGRLFPFSVSVSTRATHRLERDQKLVGYVASDLVQLAEFEGQEVELEGVWRNEKMRQIFWVEAIKVQDLETAEAEEAGPQRFTTKKFTMLLPPTWEYSLAPNGVAYFLNKEDPARRVFLTFAVEDYSVEAERIDTNIAMNGLRGIKEATTDENGKEREVITLFSALEPKKYVFTATYFFDDFETKKSVFDVLQSFVEGEEAVQEVVIAEQKAKAEAEAAKLAEAKADEDAAAALEEASDETAIEKAKDLIGELLEGEEKTPPAEVVEAETEGAPTEPEGAVEPGPNFEPGADYTNLIDARAYGYESQSLGFSLKVPYAFWFRNFGALQGTRISIGVADNPVNTTADVKLWVKVLAKDRPAEGTTELITSNGITLIKKRDDQSVFELTGPAAYRDALWSIADSIAQ